MLSAAVLMRGNAAGGKSSIMVARTSQLQQPKQQEVVESFFLSFRQDREATRKHLTLVRIRRNNEYLFSRRITNQSSVEINISFLVVLSIAVYCLRLGWDLNGRELIVRSGKS